MNQSHECPSPVSMPSNLPIYSFVPTYNSLVTEIQSFHEGQSYTHAQANELESRCKIDIRERFQMIDPRTLIDKSTIMNRINFDFIKKSPIIIENKNMGRSTNNPFYKSNIHPYLASSKLRLHTIPLKLAAPNHLKTMRDKLGRKGVVKLKRKLTSNLFCKTCRRVGHVYDHCDIRPFFGNIENSNQYKLTKFVVKFPSRKWQMTNDNEIESILKLPEIWAN